MEVKEFEGQIFQSGIKRRISLRPQRKSSCLSRKQKTGRLIWRGKKYGYGRILICQERLLILGNTGVLSVVEASPKKFTEIFSEQLLNRSRCWNGPAIVDGYLIARNGEQIACFDTAVSP